MAFATLLAVDSRAGVGGSVSGTVKDISNAVVPNAAVKATNLDTGVRQQVATNDRGFYSFPDLPVGRYDLAIERTGFKPYQRRGLVINADSALKVDVVMQLGEQAETVTVSESEVRVDTVSTQMGEVVSGATMTTQALNGRSYTDLLAIQPSVVPLTSMQSNSIVMAGVTGAINPSGELNPGNLSINGQRESANGFMVDGSDVQEHMNGGTSIIPNLDSIAEFRVLTNNFDAEYGNYNGGIVNLITKSGTEQFHGGGFEFLRNTDLDSRNFFAPTRAGFQQNQFGGTVGGPIRKGKAFFFGD